MVGNNLYSTPLNVPRTFYINSTLDPSEPEAAALGQPVKRILPFGQETFNIYKARQMKSRHSSNRRSDLLGSKSLEASFACH